MMFCVDCFTLIWMFPKIGVPQNGWFIMENPIMSIIWMIWGYHYFWKHPYRTASSYDRSSRSIDLNHPSVKYEMFSDSKSDGHLYI